MNIRELHCGWWVRVEGRIGTIVSINWTRNEVGVIFHDRDGDPFLVVDASAIQVDEPEAKP